MDFNREQELQQQIAAGGAQASDARRQLRTERADAGWQAGDRGGALRGLYNDGADNAEMVGFCRERGLSEAEAGAENRDAGIDWS